MKITIIGTGYVGLVSGACLADLGNHVLCVDVDQSKIDLLNQGGIPIHEPGLEQVVARNRASGHLQFSSDLAQGVKHGQMLFIAVGTPPDEDGSADLQYVLAAARGIAAVMDDYKVIVNKSTVPVGTGDKVRKAVAAVLAERGRDLHFSVVSNPEFLKEGAALEDFSRPERIVIGVEQGENGTRARKLMQQLYAPFQRDHDCICWMDLHSAELTKYAANAMLATRISFMNEIARLAEMVGADVEAVRHGIGSDSRIGHSFLYAGCGYGGSCFPKDVQALARSGNDYGVEMQILRAVEAVNQQQKLVLVEKICKRFGQDLRGMHFALWGLAFKPNTDDMREAPSRVLLKELVRRGATITAFDPVAVHEAQRVLEQDLREWGGLSAIRFAPEPMAALEAAQALIIVTEWSVFASPDFQEMAEHMSGRVIFDGRNLYEPQAVQEAGFEYYAIGRAASGISGQEAK